ncbi:MAG: hypothetical protein ABIN80_02385 [Dyadobacter sp.]|uniref:hypothetical protein n=1 Tax=Dyadobacter sp. TaxID=1914288 RepID=UPI0032655E4A
MINKGTLLIWQKISPENAIHTKFTLKEFLALVCLHYMGEQFTVKDVLRACSHVMGGVHTGNPESEREKLLCDWFEDSNIQFGARIETDRDKFDIILRSDETAFQTIRDICEVCLEALRPYEERAKA